MTDTPRKGPARSPTLIALPSGNSYRRIVRDDGKVFYRFGDNVVHIDLTESDIVALWERLDICDKCGDTIADGKCSC
jgi:hypothetical protein